VHRCLHSSGNWWRPAFVRWRATPGARARRKEGNLMAKKKSKKKDKKKKK